MFVLNENGSINMHVGDTGSFVAHVSRTSGQSFGSDDRALYTIKNGAGQIVMQREYALDDDELGNGTILVAFANSDTDHWTTGTYRTEMRIIINPVRDSHGKIVDGDTVRIPPNGQNTIVLLEVYGEV